MSKEQSSPRGRKPDHRLTEDVLEAALSILADGGYRALTIEAAARSAGVSRTAIYKRWDNLADLLIDVARRAAPPELVRFQRPGTGALATDFFAFVKRGMDLLDALEAVGIARPLLAESIVSPALNQRVRETLFQHDQEVFEAILEEAVERGEIPPPGPDVRNVFFGLVGYMLYRKFTLHIGLEEDELAWFCELVARGLQAPADEQPG